MIASVFQKYPENFAFQLFTTSNYLILPVKFSIFLKSDPHFNSFYIVFSVYELTFTA